jgi:hypothetical protein
MKMGKGLFTLVNLSILTGTMLCSSISGAAEKAVQGGTIPIMKKAPVIDGKIDPAEWKDAIKTEWFHGLWKRPLDPREGSTWVGCDKDKLYIAVSSELPPTGKPIATVKVQDGPTVFDSSIELWLDPFLTQRLKDASQPLPYYQFIGNSLGFVFDKVFTPGKAASDAWNGKWEIKNNIDPKKNRWDSEIAIKWVDLGVKPGTDMLGKDIGLIISRNWKNPWNQAVWFPCSNFDDPTTYPRLRIDSKAPVVQLDSMGDIFKGKFDLKLNVINPTNAKIDYAIELDMAHSDMPTTNVKKNLSVEAGKNNLFAYDFKGDGFHADAKHTVTIKVTSLDQKQDYFYRIINWGFPVEKRWKAMGLDQDAGIKFAYYPSFNKMRVQVDPEAALGENEANELKVTIKNKDESKNDKRKKPFNKTFKLAGKKVQEFAFDVPDFDDGTYNLSFEFLSSGKKVKTTEKSFERIHYAWEKSKFGITDKVYPPFTPIKVEGNNVDVVLRQYELDKLGLPQKIIAKGHDILASGGMKFNYLSADGKLNSFNKESGKFIETKGNLAVYEGQAESADLKLKAKSAIEYDGCAKVELEITPVTPGKEIKEFYLDIPLKKKYAVLWHICEAGLRSNPAGAIPEGKGIVWDSTQTGNGPILGTFLPYVWLGRAEEGIAWFADSDKGWIVDDKTPELQIIRANDGNVSLRVRFINKPVKLEKATSLVFGWQASPTKPMPADFRKPKTRIPMHGGSNRYWGIRPSYAGKYPAGRDYEFADQLLIGRKRGKTDKQFAKRWYQKHYGDVTDKELEKSVKAHIGAGLGSAARGGLDGLDVAMLYFEEHCQDQTTPEWKVFQDEWGCKDFTGRKWHEKIMANDDPQGIKINPINSYQNFAMWEELEWLKRGIGIYCDNTFLRPTTNLEMSKGAYKREDGNIQPGTGLWDMREYHKRMWVLVRQMQEVTEYPLYISLHMTNGNLLPIMTWNDINLDLEWSWNGGNDPFPPAFLRTETTGRQTGCYPHSLYPCTSYKWYKEGTVKDKHGRMYNPQALKHNWGIRRVHEILCSKDLSKYPQEKFVDDFGYGEPDCKVYNYWQDDYPVAVSNNKVKSIAFEKDGKVMVILTSWLKEKADISVALEGALSKYAKLKAVDPETGKAYEVKDGKVVVPMGKWGVRLIVFGDK